MHCTRVIHRDLKPENIFINSDGQLKIGDFGISRTFGVSSKPLSSEVVTIFYRAPEVALGIREYSIPIDIWSCGCIFAELFLEGPLFPVESDIDLISQIFKTLGTPTDNDWEDISTRLSMVMPRYPKKVIQIEGMDDTAVDLLSKMLTINPSKRISAKEALEHDYFNVDFSAQLE